MNLMNVAPELLFALVGGIAVNRLADWLPSVGASTGQTAQAPSPLRRLVVWIAAFLWPLFLVSYGPAEVGPSQASGEFVSHWLLWFCFALFLLILVIDLEHRRVLNIVVYPMAFLAVGLSLFRADISPLSALAGGAAGFALFLLLFRLRSGALGAGDVKLAGLIGLLVGFPAVFVALFAAIGLGGVAAAFLLLVRRRGRASTMAYAPYLSAGAMVALLYGPAILGWYAGRFGL